MNTSQTVQSHKQPTATIAGAEASLAKLHQMEQSLRDAVLDVNEELAIVSLQLTIDPVSIPEKSVLYRVRCTGEAAASDRSALILLLNEVDARRQVSGINRQSFWTFACGSGYREQMTDRVLGITEHLQNHPI